MSTTLQSSGSQLLQANVVDTITLTTSYVEQTIFTEVDINRGNCFNSTTGRFTAPTAGIYKFGTAMIGGNTNDVYRFTFYKNGVDTEFGLRVSTNASGSEFAVNGQMEVYLELASGDYVSIFAKSDGGNDAYGNAGFKYSYFNGRFIA